MATPFSTRTAAQVRDSYLRTQSNYLISIGVPTPNVGPGSDAYGAGQAIANEIESLYAAAPVAVDQMMPDTASGDDLVRQLRMFGDDLRPAGASTGNLVFATSSATYVLANSQLKDATGNTVYVVSSGTRANGERIAVASLSTGLSSVLDPATVLQWVTPPAFAAPTSPVDSGGLTGGTDAETSEAGGTASLRLQSYYSDPPTAGNAAQINVAASKGISAVQAAFNYPDANGPGTSHEAVIGAQADSSTQSRIVSDATLLLAQGGVIALAPEHAEYVVTKTADQLADVDFFLALPPAEAGGGWIDAQPFPEPYNAALPCILDGGSTTTSLVIDNCKYLPSNGETVCCVINGALVSAIVLSHTSTGGGPYVVTATVSIPMVSKSVSIATGAHIFPGASNGGNYVAAIIGAFAALGPGEKTAQAGLLPRAYRIPRWFKAWDYNLGPKFIKALENVGPDVLDVAWLYQNGGTTTPTISAAIADAPSVFIPRHVGFYRMANT